MAGIEGEILIDQPGGGILTTSLTRATSHCTSAHSPGGEDHPGTGPKGNPVPLGCGVDGAQG